MLLINFNKLVSFLIVDHIHVSKFLIPITDVCVWVGGRREGKIAIWEEIFPPPPPPPPPRTPNPGCFIMLPLPSGCYTATLTKTVKLNIESLCMVLHSQKLIDNDSRDKIMQY